MVWAGGLGGSQTCSPAETGRLVVSTTPYTGRSGIFDPDAAVEDVEDVAGELVALVVVLPDLLVLVGFSSALPLQAASSTAADSTAAHRMIVPLIAVP
ncbi:hypothetical protein A5630_28510 [Mycolicibacterium mucogenicum]|uniref:Uncharacterized protein n=1 Tax=Mycolicibacterium mucogenicum TaxID=56689 RepID=A0A1A3GST8_MYCMU|nr:hypothetical protein A5630_28510 [Mycolicibacterium mucogenicum]